VSETADGLVINVADDGRGLDPDKLRAKAIEKGLIDEDFGGEPRDLIFLPGFSTAETISETSGRGVGLDAVKDIVETAGGTIKVTSEKGLGTTFEVFLPG
jgi:two-component system chemotaxis sensor kinase CheA